ncbi:nuclear transport factor 2 family protein [Halosegnis marinus]|uniref:Nuclear transport factor 2 family protein n=1 Tax=Halosegnis marinus TaxID=3034023 RepID=A0ABD5ZPL9_9EURY|nr:nuclear transport factor 2 family protein [Halosegnis sp. DT85]
MDRTGAVRAYYDALDAGDYGRLRDLLGPEFRQERGDRTFEGREAFVSFMRDDRPETDTTHAVDAVYESDAGVVAEGTLRRADGSVWFRFADAFAFEGEEIAELRTYTR